MYPSSPGPVEQQIVSHCYCCEWLLPTLYLKLEFLGVIDPTPSSSNPHFDKRSGESVACEQG